MDNELETRFKRIEGDIIKLFTCTDNTNVWQGKYGEKIDTIEKSIDKMALSIQALLDKPQKRWDGVVNSSITAIVGGIIGVILTTIFYKGGA